MYTMIRSTNNCSSRRITLCSALLLLLLHSILVNAATVAAGHKEDVKIGAILSSGESIVSFTQQITNMAMMMPTGIELAAVTVPMSSNPIRTAKSVCEELIAKYKVYAVIVSHPASGEGSPTSVSFTCGFYNIPVIGISNRDSSLSNKNLHGSFMRTIPPYSHQADVWIDILKELQYQSVVFIHSADTDGRSTLGRFQYLADSGKVKVETVIEYGPRMSNLAEELLNAKMQLSCRVFILYANKEDAEMIFEEIVSLNMTSSGFVWIVSEQALLAVNKPDGILGLKLIDSDNEESHIKDSVKVVILALRELYLHSNITQPPNDCSKTNDRKWPTGIEFLETLKKTRVENGATGRVSFDENGDRLESSYQILNVIDGQLVAVGNYTFLKTDSSSEAKSKPQCELNLNKIVWPGNERKKPLGYFVPTHLKVATIPEKPFVWRKRPSKDGKCASHQIVCTHSNVTSKIDETYCCEGYCMDLLKRLAEKLNYTYELYLISDGFYGSQEFEENGSYKWNGLVGELMSKKADMVIAPLTINPERAKVIDFSKPFKYHGIAMLQRRLPKGAKLTSFLQPFQNTLWLLVMVSVHVVALVLYILDRLSPFGRFGHTESDELFQEEKSLNFSSAIWFAWGVLLNSGVGEKTPRSFSARVLGMVWAGFAMIVVASYTANLAAFLVLDSTETEITGLEDSRLRNPAEGFKYATVKGSAVDTYFSGQVELSNMYRLMEETNKNTVEEALQELKNGELNVFFWDQPRLEYEAAADCNLVISGETFGRTGYGVGLQKNSFWTERVTLVTLDATESGFMESLDNKWILKGDSDCENKEKENFPTTLGLQNMAGVFMLVAAGIVGSIGLIVIEIGYKRRRARRMRQVTSVKKAVQKWKSTVEKRKLMKGGRNAPPLPFTRSSQNAHQYNTIGDRQRKCAENSVYAKAGNADSTPFTIEKSMNEIIGRSSQPVLQPRGQLLSPHYSSHFNRSQATAAVTATAANSPHQNAVCNYPDTDMDIPPPPPPPSASPRTRAMCPQLIAYPKRTKNFIPV
ncbi:hypothetical protein B4U80_10436 [Leptotrombidium deliense]|uniref:Glutamate [NMDA] receptor subunit 1 n=1 Tax=Leptotrombidium deliense TaxID=299467 RepID=A0A443SWM0_9ACAR|nr:hypothetical protein B4U80_10436 [Leptotrombidium deliense]